MVHAADSAGNDDVNRSIKMIEDLGALSGDLSMNAAMVGIESLGLEWGFSDGN